jgi:hypothetical protein
LRGRDGAVHGARSTGGRRAGRAQRHMGTGHRPLRAGVRAATVRRSKPSAVITAILRDHPPPLPPRTPAGLARIVARCLAKEPLERPGHAGEVALALEVLESTLSSPAVHTPGIQSRARLGLILGGVAVAAALTGLAYAMWPRAAGAPAAAPFANPVQVTATVGVEEFPSWSPDGRTLAYAASASGMSYSANTAWDVWVTQPGGAPINRTADYAGRDLFRRGPLTDHRSPSGPSATAAAAT